MALTTDTHDRLLKELKDASRHIFMPDEVAEIYAQKLISRLQDLRGVSNDQCLVAIRYIFNENTVDADLDVLNFLTAKETFRKIMLIKPEDNNRDKRMPHKDQLDVLKAIDPALCKTLRDGTVSDFYNILYPNPEHDLQGTVFRLDGTKDDRKIFKDLTKRAELLAKEIKDRKESRNESDNNPVKCYLMDGHGRMFLCLIKALIDQGIDPDDDVEFIFCEIDDEVNEYHKYVFPSKVTKLKQNVLEGYGDYIEPNSVVYLNFCSIPSSQDSNTWKMNTNPRCVKENVLRFISELTRPPKSCSVMVSLVIKDAIKEDWFDWFLAYFGIQNPEKLFPQIDKKVPGSKKYITGLGFLQFIRDVEIFNSMDEDILLRYPADNKMTKIHWEDQHKRNPISLGTKRNNKRLQVFATVMVHPGQRPKTLAQAFKEKKIEIDEIARGDMVEITSQDDNGKKALVISRTPKKAKVVLDDKKNPLPITKHLSSLRRLPENEENSAIKERIERRQNQRRVTRGMENR